MVRQLQVTQTSAAISCFNWFLNCQGIKSYCQKVKKQRSSCLIAARWERTELRQQVQRHSRRSPAHTNGKQGAETTPRKLNPSPLSPLPKFITCSEFCFRTVAEHSMKYFPLSSGTNMLNRACHLWFTPCCSTSIWNRSTHRLQEVQLCVCLCWMAQHSHTTSYRSASVW